MTRSPETPQERRDFLIYYARVNLSAARARRLDRPFSAMLLGWASKARLEAMTIRPPQGDLFASLSAPADPHRKYHFR